MIATIWRTCPSCFGSFEQPDDPGRRRDYCSRACQWQPTAPATTHQHRQQHTGRQDRRSDRHEQRHQRPGSQRPGADQRQHRRQERQDQQHRQRRPPPQSANGHRPGATSGDDLARIRRIIAALLRKAAAGTSRRPAQPVRQRPRPAGAAARRAERPTRVTGTIRPDPGSSWSPRSRRPGAGSRSRRGRSRPSDPHRRAIASCNSDQAF
jgi:hypothetical protein